jgi:hypothetical protein
VPATAQEIQQIEEDEANKETLSQAIETVLVTTRGRRKHTATAEVVYNSAQAREAKRVKVLNFITDSARKAPDSP